MSPRVVCVTQARMGSARFPGKVAQMIGDRTALAHVLTRCLKIDGVDKVVCAVADTPGNEILIDIAGEAGVESFPGSEFDPLSRTYAAAKRHSADIVMRVTADCPMIDPKVCGMTLAAFLDSGLHYASNVEPRTFPQGLDCEVMDFAALEDAHLSASSSYDREHTTPYVKRLWHPHASLRNALGDQSRHRWTLDYPKDLLFMRRVAEAAGSLPIDMEQTLALLISRPELSGEPEVQDWDGLGR